MDAKILVSLTNVLAWTNLMLRSNWEHSSSKFPFVKSDGEPSFTANTGIEVITRRVWQYLFKDDVTSGIFEKQSDKEKTVVELFMKIQYKVPELTNGYSRHKRI